MLYDKNPVYPHYDHLPYAREPLKSIYVYWRLFTTLAFVPLWALTYSLIPRRFRPRASWNIRQIINVNFTRRIYKVTEVAGVTWGTRDPTVAPPENSLKETSFEWADPLPEQMRTGILKVGAPFTPVGCYVWPKETSHRIKTTNEHTRLTGIPFENGADDESLVGIYMHGGGYCHMSAHENSGTSRIPRNLVKRNILQKVYSVEYRLLQIAPFPAVVQDAAAVYAHVVNTYTIQQKKCKIVLIGDSSGGNLVLALARWLRDEGHLPLPHGLLLLSPSCDTSHSLPETLSSYIPRPNRYTDYLVDNPEPRALLQRTFLGFSRPGPSTAEEEERLMRVVHSEYVSPCSPIVLQRWGHEVKQDPEHEHERRFLWQTPYNLPKELLKTRNPAQFDQIVKRDLDNPYRQSCRYPKLFSDFPRTLVVCGDAERLVREVRSLIVAMTADGVDIESHWMPDACHDALITSEFWWDKKVLDQAWNRIEDWIGNFKVQAV